MFDLTLRNLRKLSLPKKPNLPEKFILVKKVNFAGKPSLSDIRTLIPLSDVKKNTLPISY